MMIQVAFQELSSFVLIREAALERIASERFLTFA